MVWRRNFLQVTGPWSLVAGRFLLVTGHYYAFTGRYYIFTGPFFCHLRFIRAKGSLFRKNNHLTHRFRQLIWQATHAAIFCVESVASWLVFLKRLLFVPQFPNAQNYISFVSFSCWPFRPEILQHKFMQLSSVSEQGSHSSKINTPGFTR